ncbi:DUF1700 domain-containing protein [Streptococcus panodentis]|uniref:DUF1700 domain-containing protein n=1 Tax=Streptococcus panodentis TaxID=1581472 RepID=A0ABS5AUM7_9STRE|nr:DUF1700 domain-containing protein [Streptococcus panodentis]MBP2620282.1 hypothetical protein [Streptococcus panodentis]
MTRTEYLAELEKYLKKLPRKDYQETMDYFVEYFDEVGPEGEAAAMADLGSPKEAAHEIMLNLLDKKVEEDNQDSNTPKSTKSIVQIAILSILAAPLAIPLFIVAAILTFVFFLLVFIFALVMAIGAFAFFIFGISLIWDALTLGLTTSIPAFLFTLGLSVLALGLSGIFYAGISPISQFGRNGFVKLAQLFAKKGVRHG